MRTARILGCLLVIALSVSAYAGDLLIRGEVNLPDGPKIRFSVPVQILDALKTSGLSAMMKDREQFSQLVDSLCTDLESMKGKNLLAIKFDEHAVEISVAEVDNDSPEEANFLKIDIQPKDDEPAINISLPKGLFFLSAFIGNQFMEMHGQELLNILKQQIQMNCMPHAPMGEFQAPACPKASKCPKMSQKDEDEGDDDNENNEEKDDGKDEERKESKDNEFKKVLKGLKSKDIDHDAIKKLIFEAILKELK